MRLVEADGIGGRLVFRIEEDQRVLRLKAGPPQGPGDQDSPATIRPVARSKLRRR